MVPGATVMSIVPQSDDLKVEVRVPPVDIDRVAARQMARLRFTAFNQRTTPELEGRVEIVAAATTMDRTTGQPYYLASIDRSEEHTSELQSLMRISYAVFCLKKKN